MNWDRALHVVNALALLVAALYFVFRLEANSELLAQKLATIDNKLDTHTGVYAHPGARDDIASLARSVDTLLRVTEYHEREIDRLRDNE